MFPVNNPHTFHIPVMGTGFTADTPVRVAQFGISSVISLADDILMERLREFYCKAHELIFEPIKANSKDYRERRITSYLNLLDRLAKEKFKELKESLNGKSNSIMIYIEMLPDFSEMKKDFYDVLHKAVEKHKDYDNIKYSGLMSGTLADNENHNICLSELPEVVEWVNNNLIAGPIDVNIMTRVDKVNYMNGEELPAEYNDAHAAATGFALSNLNSSLVLSAGMNPHLYSHLEQFDDFYPDYNGNIKKKIILKVSDYRSAIIQGKFLAKKGLWVSEFRIESGLNCGGHAFTTDGWLMGPILEEFKKLRAELNIILHEIYAKALTQKGKIVPEKSLPIKLTAQGGVGTASEHRFLLDYYQLDSVGWGTPFLLVPEVTNMNDYTREKLSKANEDDLYLSNISPLGVPFNNLRGNEQDVKKERLAAEGKPGSPCSKKFMRINRSDEYGNLCPASSAYQKRKIKELDALSLSDENYKHEFNKIIEKACLCHGLGNSAIKEGVTYPDVEGTEISVCPGPNMAFFSKITTLPDMVSHIYGRTNIIERDDRPNMFVKELDIYINFLKTKIDNADEADKNSKAIKTFAASLNSAIEYYQNIFTDDIIKKYSFPADTPQKISELKNKMRTFVSEDNVVISHC